VRLSARRPDDADVIRARLRALLEDSDRAIGWLPEYPPDEDRPDDRPDECVPGRGDRPAPPADDAADPPEGIGRHRAPGTALRWNPGRSGARALWLAAALAAVVLVGWTWLDRPTVEPVSSRVPATASAVPSADPAAPSVGEVADTTSALVVSVVGLVARPGIVTLPPGSRVADAVEAAGGLLPEADPATVNLAAVVTDGQQIAVGVTGAQPGPAGSAAAPAASGKVDLNMATTADLDALPGIGPVLAQRIVDYRTQQGPFRSVDELDDVPGIGPAIFGQLVELVAVTG
jgi:competence protein ComEA